MRVDAVKIVIVGAGIGGLCAARAAGLAGHESVVLERSPAGVQTGAGLLLWPNAVHALDALGHGRAVRAVAEPARRTVFRDGKGRTLSQLDIELMARRAGAPMLLIERTALHEVLADGIAVRRGATVSAADGRGVTLADGERINGDAVIGADGIGSVVREYVCPGARSLDSGYTVVRGVSDHEIPRGEAFEAWGRGELVGGAALPAGRSYWFYEARSAVIDGKDPLAVVGAGRWPAPIPAQIAATSAERVLVNRIMRLSVLPTWVRGTAAVLGDAAHAMEPSLGQGAAQAIEDAEALLVALRMTDEISGALASYAAARRPRAQMLQQQSSRFARLALSRHSGPRDLMMSLSPQAARLRMMERLMHRHAPRRPEAVR